MIRLLDDAIEAMLRKEVPLSRQIDIDFNTPDSAWSNTIQKATVNVFLWDIRRSVHEARAGSIRAQSDGKGGVKLAPPRIAFRYHVTAWSPGSVQDEHEVLGAILAALLRIRVMPEEYRTGELGNVLPAPDFRVATPDADDFVDFWSSIEGKLKAGLDLVVTATVDSSVFLESGPPISSVGARGVEKVRDERSERVPGGMISETTLRGGRVQDPTAVGAHVVVSRPPDGGPSRRLDARPEDVDDATLVDEKGEFLVAAQPGDTVTVESDPPLSAVVPRSGPILPS